MKIKNTKNLFLATACLSLSLIGSTTPAFAVENSDILSNYTNISYEELETLSTVFTEDEITAISEVSTEDEIDELVLALKYPQQYIATKNAAKVELRAAPNGCSYSPDKWGKANFKPSCSKHDICYSPSSRTNRYTCDTTFRTRLKGECKRVYSSEKTKLNACNVMADVYYNAVRTFGSSHYEGKGKNN